MMIDRNRPFHTLRLWLMLAVLLTCSTLAQALGLGELRVQSMLGQPLRASVPVFGQESDSVLQVCVKAKVLALDGTFMMALRVTVNTDPRSPALLLTSTQMLAEPAFSVLVEVICESNLSRQYQVLLDPPETMLAPVAKAPASPDVVASYNAAGNTADSAGAAGATGAAGVAASMPSRAERRAAARAAALEQKRLQVAADAARPEADKRPQPAAASPAGPATDRPAADLKAATRLTPAQPRNVLKVTGEQSAGQDIAGNPLPMAVGKPGQPAAQAAPSDATLKLLLSRRLASDTSPISKAQVQAFSETVRQEQNSAVLIEVGRAEVRTLQKQIEQLEAELKQARMAAGAAGTAAPTPGPSPVLPVPVPALPQNRAQEWVIGLAALLLMCLLAIGWLLWRLLQLRSRRGSFSAGLASAPTSASTSASTSPSTSPSISGPTVGPQASPGPASSVLASIFTKAQQSSASAMAQLRSRNETAPRIDPEMEPPATTDGGKGTGSKGAGSHGANNHGASNKGHSSKDGSSNDSRKVQFGKGSNKISGKGRSNPAGNKLPPANPLLAPEPSAARHEIATSVTNASPALPALEVPLELYKAEKVAQADEPLEFTFPDELEFHTEEQTSALQGLHRNSIDYATETAIPTVEEFTDVMYEAEFWISLGKLDKAIAVLEQYTAYENVSSPLPWIFLFDMYRKTDSYDQYLTLQRQFERMFNGKIPEWEDYDIEYQNMGLENMAGLMSRVEAFWMTDEIVPFLENLLVDDRDGTRQGFELGVYRDILFLIDIAKEVQKSNEYEKLSTAFKLAPLE